MKVHSRSVRGCCSSSTSCQYNAQDPPASASMRLSHQAKDF
ncbi:Protein of unknown function [Pyronema omphalodes CBS 100304]|uniref:Uncharacterized protein n=1 Tax=Pyronema omphalodes (strain CBS 100304) TaxID=1076935 RepID=U4LF88_PYROM|nr:Protein of unknown function [Pyronema omphalodes CBS 100304]